MMTLKNDLLALACVSALAVTQVAADANRHFRHQVQPPPFAGDATCDTVGASCVYPNVATCSPVATARDAVRDRIWVAGELCDDSLNLKSFPAGDFADCNAISECQPPTSGEATGVAVLSNGNLLLSDFNGDLSRYDDHLVEVDPDSCDIVFYWIVDDSDCGGCEPNPGPEDIDEVLGLDIRSEVGSDIFVSLATNLSSSLRQLVLHRDGTTTSTSTWELDVPGEELLAAAQIGVDLVNQADDREAAVSSLITGELSCLDENLDVTSTCPLPSGLPGGITELDNGNLMHVDLFGTLQVIEGCSPPITVDLELPTIAPCPGPTIQARITGENRTTETGQLAFQLISPISFTFSQFAIPPGSFSVSPIVRAPGSQPPVCPSILTLSATLLVGADQIVDTGDVEAIPLDLNPAP